MEIPVELSRLIINESSEQQLIVLKEKAGTRAVPIVIGIVEIFAIDRRHKGIRAPRPMTHDLVGDIIEKLGGKIVKVVVDDLVDHTFFAKIHILLAGKITPIDARPSDAIAIGVGFNVPFFVEDHVLDATGKD
ncbi:bifunctional nuclease family protein [Planctomycetota bacterium]